MAVLTSRSFKSTQVSFIIHSITGEHFGKQVCVTAINKRAYVLEPRNTAKNKFYYESGYTTYVDQNNEILFSVAIGTPRNKDKFYFHCFVQHRFTAPDYPCCQHIKLVAPGNSYVVSASLFTTYSQHIPGAGSPSRTSLRSSYNYHRTMSNIVTHRSPNTTASRRNSAKSSMLKVRRS